MEEFDALIGVADKLLAPGGCPWDQTQTFMSLRTYVIEEAHEVVEAVDEGDPAKMVEELGDLLYTVVFYAKVAERQGAFSLSDILHCIREKLVRRHPHVFGEVAVSGTDEVIANWERIKKEEKKDKKPSGLLEGIPPTTPLLIKAQKILKKIQRAGCDLAPKGIENSASEEEIGERMLGLVLEAENAGLDAESALRKALSKLNATFGATFGS